MLALPIDSVIPELRLVLQRRLNTVLTAPPGSGKTTKIPLVLLTEEWLDGKKIIMLEPRRLAARAAARYMAALLGEKVGETVGYRVRQDTKVSKKTRIEVVTEGILTRMLQADPTMDNIGLVIFDEFHERNIHSDLGLALCFHVQKMLRQDLRMIIMSATLNSDGISSMFGDIPIVRGNGTAFSVETKYLTHSVGVDWEKEMAAVIKQALVQHEGDILAFLPGIAEIRRVERLLKESNLAKDIMLFVLHGNLPFGEQAAALIPAPAAKRKIVLATSIAETSITVEGINTVVDCGLMRVPKFSPRTGMTRLETVPVSRASADQRRGRAGRLRPGVCYRLWTAIEDSRLQAQNTPEMYESDLAALVLDLAAWGINRPEDLSWVDCPPSAAFGQARELLAQLGALNDKGCITEHGGQMAAIGVHPRLSHMMVKAKEMDLEFMACVVAVLLDGRDVFGNTIRHANPDLRLRVDAISPYGTGRDIEIDKGMQQSTLDNIRYWKNIFSISKENWDSSCCGILLAFAYPDRIAQRKGGGRFLLRNGRGGCCNEKCELAQQPFLVAAELDDTGPDSRIILAASLETASLVQYFQDEIVEEQCVSWDSAGQLVRARCQQRLGAMVLKETPVHEPSSDAVVAALLKGIADEGLELLPWTKQARILQRRLLFMHHFDEKWPDTSDSTLMEQLEQWLTPYIYGIRNSHDLQQINLVHILLDMIPWGMRAVLDEYAPTHILVPSGQRISVDYQDERNPVLAVRLQEMFGLADTPRIAGGKAPLTLHLLSPAQRPVQITQDLAGFWRNTYFEVKKDLAGRYPKHDWPDDPLAAKPTHRARPKSR